MTYTELVNAIQDYTENSFATFDVNTFIQQAEQRIYNSVQFPALRRNVVGLVTAGNKYLSAPADFLAVYSIAAITPQGDYEFLINKDVNFIRQAYPNPNSQGLPRYYALFGPTTTNDNPPALTDELSFILGPTPDFGYSIELHYFFYPESITVAADGRTWLGDNFDSVLLYGSLVEAYTFMKGEPDLLTAYDAKYKEAMALAMQLGNGLERGDAYRNGQLRMTARGA